MSDRMGAHQRLHRGEKIFSPNRALQLVMQDDGNLVLYKRKDGEPLWSSGTHGSGADTTIMQDDGNLVVYRNGNPEWASGTHGNHGAYLRLQNDANLVIYGPGGSPIWSTDTYGRCSEQDIDVLRPEERLKPGQSIHSKTGNTELILQDDGNLVLHRTRDGAPIWASNTHGNHVREAVMQGDGNLVIYDNNGSPIWASNTHGQHGSQLHVQDDGNLCIYDSGNPIWASGTHGQC